MNILIVPFSFPSGENRTAGIFILEQCLALSRRGHQVTVLHADPVPYTNWFSSKCFKLKKTENEGIRIYSMNYPAVAIGIFPRFASFSYHFCLKHLWNKYKNENGRPDIIHAHFVTYAGYHSLKLAKMCKAPLVVTEHYSMFLEAKLKPFVKKILKITIKGAEEFICVSASLKNKIEMHYGEKIKAHIVPNMVDPSFAYQKPVKKNGFTYFSAGSLIALKKMDLLIEAFASAFRGEQSVKLEIAGEGEQYRKLKRLIDKLGMQEQILLLGALTRCQMVEKMTECDAFAMLSEKETFGVVYREAMAVGRPVVAAQNGGIDENWDDMHGILVPPNNVDAAACALKRMKDTIALYDAEAISRRCLAHYCANTVIDSLENIYGNAIAEYLDRT